MCNILCIYIFHGIIWTPDVAPATKCYAFSARTEKMLDMLNMGAAGAGAAPGRKRAIAPGESEVEGAKGVVEMGFLEDEVCN